MVRILLEARANVDQENCWGNRSVLAAAASGHLGILHSLIAAQASLNEADISGRTPLTAAIAANRVDALQLLIHARANVDDMYYGWADIPLHAAASAGQLEVVRLLLRAQANVNASGTPDTSLAKLCLLLLLKKHNLVQLSSECSALSCMSVEGGGDEAA